MRIRPETPLDYAAIARVHVTAFGRAPEALIVALLRQRAAFDSALSLVAEEDGRVVGHALFSPYQMRLLGQAAPIVNLAPLAVEPAYQGRGIGGALIAEGHVEAAARGYVISVLLGHPSYYPRFGYHTHAFGVSTLEVAATTAGSGELERRAPVEADVPALRALWQAQDAGVDFALDPGPDLLDWLSPNPAITASVYLHAGEVVGYTRVHAADPARPRVFLARDADIARVLIAALAAEAGTPTLKLPLHPASACAAALGAANATSWEAAMAIELQPSPLADYLALMRAGDRPPGRLIWPVAFDLP